MNLLEIKNLVENNPVALATITLENKPNVIGVASVKVVSENQVLITDNYMNQTIKDIENNKNVCLAVWDKNLKGIKLVGEAEYFTNGKWKEFVEQMQENKELPAKGAILVNAFKIIESK
ncbi:MAG: hypothetical protein A3G45_02400 [Candidatus Staskawiczbacteria bacterium RIFCSPLOWO2_12_FULL_37_15]|uniref:Pyridoxamine 5'-phosphate oxidase N-terminal domain-containing protein n=1 Tax=Candidatus Staskawiczbacteria bacterium RIFCSPLOWO2_12_FULL_37_15 TaxID=1802218 RepID=A0A1G2IM37_9BACT|nr:MAG: Pyridoxamine 5'-phosphate oxidase-related FMN-binding protein [Parcubacteria group bacterium GW2011_GWA2_37_10]OGZ75944.1 MAG: hypothetical protein A3G45_02400 [Candidatus Staskawiczbacteria bacterium RIFCSPLOWO2_12_FULL_37_15]